MRHLKQNTSAVSRTRITTLRPSMAQAFKNLKALLNNRMRFLACDIHDKTDPARVFLLFRVVEALLRWKPWDAHRAYLVKMWACMLLTEATSRKATETDNSVTRKENFARIHCVHHNRSTILLSRFSLKNGLYRHAP